MFAVFLVVYIMVAAALVGVILLQRSEGGGLGIGGGGGGGMSGFMTGRGTANLLTRATAVLALVFMALSVLLTFLGSGGKPRSVMDRPAPTAPAPAQPPGPPQAPIK